MGKKSKKDIYAGVKGSPGEKPRFVGFVRATWPFLVLVFVGGYLLRAAFPFPILNRLTVGILMLLLCGVFGTLIFWSERRLGAFVKGAKGEELVARQLALLPSTYRVFHGLSLKGSMLSGPFDCDHVVVGPTGIFAIETKNWSGAITLEEGQILYDGQEPTRSPVEQAKNSALDLQRAICESCESEVTVHPLVCFAGSNFAKGVTGTSGVVVCGLPSLREAITDSVDASLPEATIADVVAFLEDKIA